MTDKQKFICNYLDKKMEGHGLSFGMAYLILLSKTSDEAESEWKKLKKTKKQTNDNRNR